MRCRDCGAPAVAIDLDYGEGYCQRHWEHQQRSTEPVEWYRLLD